MTGNKCQATFAKEIYYSFAPVCFGFAKNGPYSKAFNQLYKKFNIIIKF
jgi:hypothetical protein